MNLNELTREINKFKSAETTAQSWRKSKNVNYANEYLTLKRIDSSNVAGGTQIKRGKQWSIIIEFKNGCNQDDFEKFSNWKNLENVYKNDILINMVKKGELKGCNAIRFYKMASDPTDEIVCQILNYICNI